jgi:hypothetical protein
MRTLENAIIADKILDHIKDNGKDTVCFANGLRDYLLKDLEVDHVEFIFSWIRDEFGNYAKVEKSNNGTGNLFIKPNRNTKLFLLNGGITKIIKKEIESNAIKEETNKYDLVTKKWYYKTRLVPYIISSSALIISVITLLISINKENKQEKTPMQEKIQQVIKNDTSNKKDMPQIKHN